MKVISIVAAGVALALIALTLTPSAGEYHTFFALGALVCIGVALVTMALGWRERPPVTSAGASSATQSTSGDAAIRPAVRVAPPPPPVKAISGDAEVVGFLATLQERGRLVDFLRDDIAGYSDAQVGAAARVVHQGCKAVLDAYFRVVPVREESEGAKVTVPAGYIADEYRLVGKISGEAPFSGTLMHRGWKAASVSLPRILRTGDDTLPIIAPAEVELR